VGLSTDEYRAITRNLLHLAGTITYTTKTITVVLDRPATPRLTRAVRLLLDEINTTPPDCPATPAQSPTGSPQPQHDPH
jgi:MoxR-like ATPase